MGVRRYRVAHRPLLAAHFLRKCVERLYPEPVRALFIWRQGGPQGGHINGVSPLRRLNVAAITRPSHVDHLGEAMRSAYRRGAWAALAGDGAVARRAVAVGPPARGCPYNPLADAEVRLMATAALGEQIER